jgi:hypothetical protein
VTDWFAAAVVVLAFVAGAAFGAAAWSMRAGWVIHHVALECPSSEGFP